MHLVIVYGISIFLRVDFVFGTVVFATEATNGGAATSRVGTKRFVEARTDDGEGSVQTRAGGGDKSVVVE